MIAKHSAEIAFGDIGRAIAKRCCKQFVFGDVEGAIAKRDLGITFWNTRSAISVKIKEILEGMKR
jgi:hypothetical protein